MARRGPNSSDRGPTSRKRKSASERLRPVLAETGDDAQVDAAGDPLTLEAPRKRRANRKAPAKAKTKTRRTGRIAAAVVATVAVGAAVTVGVVQAMHAHGHRPPLSSNASEALSNAHEVAAVVATPAAITVEAHPLTEYAPPDREQVSNAFLKVGATYRSDGLSGVVRQSMDCFSGLKSAPNYATLDFCIAADAFGEALERKLTDGQAPAKDSYFAAASSRELEAARTVVGVDGDAGARVLDIHRLAGEVSNAGTGPASVLVASNEHAPPPALVAAPREAPAAVTPPVESSAPIVRAARPKREKTRARVVSAEQPRLIRVAASAKPSHAQVRLAVASKPHVARHAAPDDGQADAPPWNGAIRAIRASLTTHNDLANRRAGEPTEWVDCHRPRTAEEIRMCEGPTGGDGTLQSQYRSNGNR